MKTSKAKRCPPTYENVKGDVEEVAPSTRVIGVDASGWGCRLPLYCHDDLLLTRHTHTHADPHHGTMIGLREAWVPS